LNGGLGNDRLAGGLGNDLFVFFTAPNALTNRDTLIDYNPAQDQMALENAVFSRLPASAHLNPVYFRAATHALDANDYIVYNRATGALFYDSNGSAAGHAVQFATLLNRPVLTAFEFAIV
jgi:Ca2+-binding RTX toxin-like protein